MRVDGAVPNAVEVCSVVDVFAATKSFTLSRHGSALLPPFTVLPRDTSFGAEVTTKKRLQFHPEFPHSVNDPGCALHELSPLPVDQDFGGRDLKKKCLSAMREQSPFRGCGGDPDGGSNGMAAEELGPLRGELGILARSEYFPANL